MARTKKVNPANIQNVDLENVRHTFLGSAIECMDTEIYAAEATYLKIRDSDPITAEVIRQLLERIDSLKEYYNEVR